MRRTLIATLLVALGTGHLPYLPGQVVGEHSPARKAAKARQKAVKTLEVKFRKTETIARGAVTALTPPLPFKPKHPIPEQETTLQSINRLVIDGEKLRYENNHPTFILPDVRPTEKRMVCLFNGTRAKLYFPKLIPGRGLMQGVILRHPRIDFVLAVELEPLTLAFRPFSPSFSADLLPRMKPSGVALPIEGALCQEYLFGPPQGFRRSYWLDPAKDHLPRRIRIQSAGRLADQIEVRYRRQDGRDWIPAAWVRTQYSTEGAVLSTTRFEVLELRVNAEQPPELFDVRFPEGIEVYDQRDDKSYRIQSDGSMRELSRKGQLLPRSVPQPDDSWYQRNRGLLVVAGILVILLVAVSGWIWLMRRRKRLP